MTELVPGLQLHVELADSEPPIERTLVVPASIPLSDLHLCLQAAFGWENRHLYQFVVGDSFRGERTFSDVEAAFELEVEDASRFTLGELVAGNEERFVYEYDFGDQWDHLITVADNQPVPYAHLECSTGNNRGPVEDSGGIHGYMNLSAALQKTHGEDALAASEWYEAVTGQTAATFDPARVNLPGINANLELLSQLIWRRPVAPGVIKDVVRPVQWLLQRVGAEGMELTKDGYLKPAVVQEIMTELGWEDRWYGKFNRESQTLPVLDLREQVQEWKLLRKYKGKLVRTPLGRKLVDNDAALWDYLATSIARPGRDAAELVNAVVVPWLVGHEPPAREQRAEIVAEILNASGFRVDGRTVSATDGRILIRDTIRTLECLNVFRSVEVMESPDKLSDGGRQFLFDVQRKQHKREPQS
ncbi:hypothetical protein BJ994_000666 [Arthrobacter pigmenti]|uniref:Plasmid pRiA4b Orf3-like domain-containing protein n=1 Tax=Arthrobacter pigmenti TaxID=271432 RepID=A0A846RIT2_9MICC|nr:plasmid pRiA4b ORF-3 family protein [Arthrobacter pigmenti]NJC21590.1 hypothetical protein [Arthrobacter pigmenti]